MKISQETIDEVRAVSEWREPEKFIVCVCSINRNFEGCLADEISGAHVVTRPSDYQSAVQAINVLFSSDRIYWIQPADRAPSIQSACWRMP